MPQIISPTPAPPIALVPYPDTWPKPTHKGYTLVCRITEQQKLELYNRVITTRALAKLLNVREAYLSTIFPGKIEPSKVQRNRVQKRKIFLETRQAFRREQAARVYAGSLSIAQAAELANTSYRNMARVVAAYRKEMEASHAE